MWKAIDVMEEEAKPRIVNLKRLSKPEGQEKLDLTPELWWMLTKCWETDPEDRITVLEMLNFLSYMWAPSLDEIILCWSNAFSKDSSTLR